MKRIDSTYVDRCHKKITEAVAIVSATGNEHQCLWSEFSKQATPLMKLFLTEGNYKRFDWESDQSGYFAHLGHFCEAPVCVSITFAKIEGHTIVFWHATSEVVHHGMIEDFFKSLNTKATNTDAGNFVNILHVIENRNAKEIR